jgi:hypothetical protein
MKVLFSGPSLGPAERAAFPGLDHRGPAARGDVTRAVEEGATAIGIVDGLFGSVPAVWHKEILFALSVGVRVGGGGSMGALRASECAAFGMVPIGVVTWRFAAGLELDDAYVAQIHAPAELGWTPLSEALANADATLAVLRRRGLITTDERNALDRAGRATHYADRSLARLPERAGVEPGRAAALTALLKAERVDRKGRDALKVARWLDRQEDARGAPPAGWRFHETSQWLAFLEEHRRS